MIFQTLAAVMPEKSMASWSLFRNLIQPRYLGLESSLWWLLVAKERLQSDKLLDLPGPENVGTPVLSTSCAN